MTNTKKAAAQSFEQSLTELETIVKNMDSGELSLEASLQAFEQGIGLIRSCQTQLQQAELKVKQLIESEQGLTLTEFPEDIHSKHNKANDDFPF